MEEEMSSSQSILAGLGATITSSGIINNEAIEPQNVGDEIYNPDSRYIGERENEAYSSGFIREVHIKPLNSGYLVNVGCQTVAVETTETLLKALGEYLNNPSEFERNWNRNPNRNKL